MFNNTKEILKYTFSSVICLIGLVIFLFIFEFDLITSLILTIIMGIVLYYRSSKVKRSTKNGKYTPVKGKPLERVSSQKENFYRSKGLSKDEMNLFRNTMHSAREDIYKIEENVQSRNKLKAIVTRNNTINILKDFFKHIVEQPERLHEVNKLLYTYLPNLKELTNQYVEIDGHIAKNKETYQSLENSATTIDEMCKLITKEYLDFMSNDIDNMDIELELANHVLKRDNKENIEVKEPSENEL